MTTIRTRLASLALLAFASAVPAAAQSVLLHVPELDVSTARLAGLKGSGWLEVDSFALGLENSVDVSSVSSGSGAGKATFDAIRISKAFDAASSLLAQRCASGQHLQEASIYVLASDVAAKRSWQEAILARIDLKLVMVEAVDVAGNESGLRENIVLQFGAIRVQPYERGADGISKPASRAFEWSRVKNTAEFSV